MTIATIELNQHQRQILRTAFTNHEFERRRTPLWRAGIVAFLPEDTQEASTGTGKPYLPDAIPFNPSLAGRSRGDEIGQTRNALEAWSSKNLPSGSGGQVSKGHNPQQLENYGLIPWFLPAQSVRAEAVKMRDKWASRGLNTGLFSDFEQKADLYEWEVLSSLGWVVSLGRLEYTGQPQRLPAPIEIALPKPQRAKARGVLNDLLNPLEAAGLIVRVRGRHVAWEWAGLQLTLAGKELVEQWRNDPAAAGNDDEGTAEANATNAVSTPAKEKPWITLRCPSCTGTALEFDPEADPEKPVHGGMFRFDTKHGPGGLNWSPPFSFLDDTGPDSITCPLCDVQLTDGTGRLKDGCLYLPFLEVEETGEAGL